MKLAITLILGCLCVQAYAKRYSSISLVTIRDEVKLFWYTNYTTFVNSTDHREQILGLIATHPVRISLGEQLLGVYNVSSSGRCLQSVRYKDLLDASDPVSRRVNVTIDDGVESRSTLIEVPYIDMPYLNLTAQSISVNESVPLQWKMINRNNHFNMKTGIECSDDKKSGWLKHCKSIEMYSFSAFLRSSYEFSDSEYQCIGKYIHFVILDRFGNDVFWNPIGNNIFKLKIQEDSFIARIDYEVGLLILYWNWETPVDIPDKGNKASIVIDEQTFPIKKNNLFYESPLIDMTSFTNSKVTLILNNLTFDYKEWPKLSLGAVKLYNFGEDLSYYLPDDFTYFPKVYVSGSFLQPVVMKCDNDVIDAIDATSPWPQPETLSFVIPISCHNRKLSVSIEGLQTLTFAIPLLVLPRNTSIEPVHYELDGNKLIISWNHPSFCVASRALPVTIDFGSKSVEVDICKVSKTEISNFKEGLAINWHSRFDRIANQVILNSNSTALHNKFVSHRLAHSIFKHSPIQKFASPLLLGDPIQLSWECVNLFKRGTLFSGKIGLRSDGNQIDILTSILNICVENSFAFIVTEKFHNKTLVLLMDENVYVIGDKIIPIQLAVSLNVKESNNVVFSWTSQIEKSISLKLQSFDKSIAFVFPLKMRDLQFVVPLNALSGASHWQWNMEYEGVEMQVLSDSKQFCIAVPLNVTLNVDGWLSWNDMSCLLPGMDYNAKVLYGDLELFIIESIRQSNRILLTLPEQPWQYDIVFQSHLQSLKLFKSYQTGQGVKEVEVTNVNNYTMPLWQIFVICGGVLITFSVAVAIALMHLKRQRMKRIAVARAFSGGNLHIFHVGPLENIAMK